MISPHETLGAAAAPAAPTPRVYGVLCKESRLRAVWPTGEVPLVAPVPQWVTLAVLGKCFSWLIPVPGLTPEQLRGIAEICSRAGQADVETVLAGLRAQPHFPLPLAEIDVVVLGGSQP